MKITITIPAWNEGLTLPRAVPYLINCCQQNLPGYDWNVVIADNGSTDNTSLIAKQLVSEYPVLRYIYVPVQGRGRALMQSWKKFPADVYIYIDADMDIHPHIIAEGLKKLEQGRDLILASRLHPQSRIDRPWVRRIMSRVAAGVMKVTFRMPMVDTQCGCKLMTHTLLTQVGSTVNEKGWFFDTELFLRTRKAKYSYEFLPVDDVMNRLGPRHSKVSKLRDSLNFLRVVYKLKRQGL